MDNTDTSEELPALERVPDIPGVEGLAFFFDMDGTLAPITKQPLDAWVPDSTLQILQRLVRACEGAVAIVSGRPLAEIDGLLAPLVVPVAGLHGSQWRGPDGVSGELDVDEAAVADMAARLEPLLTLHPDLLLELKRLSLALHYRMAPDCAEVVHSTMEQLIVGYPDFVLQPGKMVVEIKSRQASKAVAIASFLRQAPFVGRQPVFIGDDLTDEPGFAAVNAMGGVTIKIGGGETCAQWRLADPASLARWLGERV